MPTHFIRPGRTVRARNKVMTLAGRNTQTDQWLAKWRDNQGRDRWAVLSVAEIQAVQTPEGFRTILPDAIPYHANEKIVGTKTKTESKE